MKDTINRARSTISTFCDSQTVLSNALSVTSRVVLTSKVPNAAVPNPARALPAGGKPC